MLLSLEWRFSRGRFLTPALLGYDKVEVPDGHGGHKKVLRINEEEAKTVARAFFTIAVRLENTMGFRIIQSSYSGV